ncbi:MAG: hypothetical protein AAB492_00600 [Patescibacteria group bacterium]
MFKKTQNMLVVFGEWIHENQLTFLAFVSILIVAEVFVFPISKDVRLFGGLFLYWFFARTGKLTSVRVFQVCFVLLVVMAISYLVSSASISTERFAVWLVLFMALGLIAQWREITA